MEGLNEGKLFGLLILLRPKDAPKVGKMLPKLTLSLAVIAVMVRIEGGLKMLAVVGGVDLGSWPRRRRLASAGKWLEQ